MIVTLLSFKCITFDKGVISFSKDFKPLLSDAEKKTKAMYKSHLQHGNTDAHAPYRGNIRDDDLLQLIQTSIRVDDLGSLQIKEET